MSGGEAAVWGRGERAGWGGEAADWGRGEAAKTWGGEEAVWGRGEAAGWGGAAKTWGGEAAGWGRGEAAGTSDLEVGTRRKAGGGSVAKLADLVKALRASHCNPSSCASDN